MELALSYQLYDKVLRMFSLTPLSLLIFDHRGVGDTICGVGNVEDKAVERRQPMVILDFFDCIHIRAVLTALRDNALL